MQKEVLSLQNVKKYLIDLGYPEMQILSNVRIDKQQSTDFSLYGKELDLVVYKNNSAWIVVEVKNNIDFPVNNANELRYNPYVRKLQSYARSINAPYYLLSNGESNLWFTTDASGRPQKIVNPILPYDSNFEEVTSHKSELIKVLKEFKNILLQNQLTNDIGFDASIILLARLLSESGEGYLSYEINNKDSYYLINNVLNILGLEEYRISNFDKEVVSESLRLLNYISFRELDPKDLISAIDEVFLKNIIKREYKISRWLADFLVKLSNVNSHSSVLDISSSFGEIPAAVKLCQAQNQFIDLYGICHSIEGSIWAKIQQIILGNGIHNIFIDKGFNGNILEKFNIPIVTNIISALPFGLKYQGIIKNFEPHFKFSKIEDILLQMATQCTIEGGRIVILVPESFLFEGGQRRNFRKYLLNRFSIKAIISMPMGALLPYSNVKSSILVIDKKPSDKFDYVFVASVDEFNQKNTFNCSEIPEIKKILDEFNHYFLSDETSVRNEYSCIISSNNLDFRNLSASSYLIKNKTPKEESPYLMMYLKDISREVQRGKSIKLDDTGDINVLGPAVIRPLEISTYSLSKASNNKLGNYPIQIKQGDVVINNIGTYLGAAALIGENLEDTYISQHVVLIRPDTNIVLPEYLAIALNSKYVKNQIIQKATGSVMPSIPISGLREVMIPVPDLHMQEYIIDKINKSQDEIQQIKRTLLFAEEKLESMISTLLIKEGV